MKFLEFLIHQMTYYRFRSLLFNSDCFSSINRNNNLDYVIKEIDNRLHLGIKVSNVLGLYILPSKGCGDYRLMYKIGEVDFQTAPAVLFELNLNATLGNIVGFPQSVDDVTSNQDMFYSCEVKRQTLISKTKLKKFISELEHESAYKLNNNANNVVEMLKDIEANDDEWMLNEEEN